MDPVLESSVEWMHSPTCPANKTPLLELPKIEPRTDDGLCKCRPTCKNRRHEWQGQLLETSVERLRRRLRPESECIRRWHGNLAPNSPCPMVGRSRRYQQQSRRGSAIRLCQAPLDAEPETPYLNFVELLKKIGADAGLRIICPFCQCGGCCNCARGAPAREYAPRDPERGRARCADMRDFDARVKEDHGNIRAMYEIPDE